MRPGYRGHGPSKIVDPTGLITATRDAHIIVIFIKHRSYIFAGPGPIMSRKTFDEILAVHSRPLSRGGGRRSFRRRLSTRLLNRDPRFYDFSWNRRSREGRKKRKKKEFEYRNRRLNKRRKRGVLYLILPVRFNFLYFIAKENFNQESECIIRNLKLAQAVHETQPSGIISFFLRRKF